MLNSNLERSESEGSSSGSSTSEYLKTLRQENYMTSEDECSPCQQGMTCEKDDDEDDLYKIYSQFKELSKDKDHIPEEIPIKEGSYTVVEVKNLLLERRKLISSPTTISDLKKEIDNLKEDIVRLKENNVVIEVRLDAIKTRQDLENY
ncbi:hypothetical protein H5410_057117 [Solanum commersonii]|uniref:Uncharacterized protein n=1 Tax=Solanum commersonii TaxID=4109 RepID=A0A9J5WP69_SOLCO|nr:hypothetical protein H5410_057117 [Solanum commersonii]